MIYLSAEDLVHIAERTLGNVEIRDMGLLDSAAQRPAATLFGDDAYPTVHSKAAAMMHSIARNHALIDGNKRLALTATISFYGVNGFRLAISNDDAYNLVMAVATSKLDDIEELAHQLQRSVEPWV